MVLIKTTGSYERPIVRIIEEETTVQVVNDKGETVKEKQKTGKLITVYEDEKGNKTETIELRGDAVYLHDGENTHLIPLKIGKAEAKDGWLIIYQSGQPLRYYKYPFECNIQHSSLEDLAAKVTALFVKEEKPEFTKEATTEEQLKENIRLSKLKIEAYELQLHEQALRQKVEAIPKEEIKLIEDEKPIEEKKR